MDTLRFDGAWCGHDEDISGVGVGSKLDGRFGADKVQIWVLFAKISDTSSGSGIAGDDDDCSTPISEGFNVISDDGYKFGIGFLAIGTVGRVGNVFVFLVWEDSLNRI